MRTPDPGGVGGILGQLVLLAFEWSVYWVRKCGRALARRFGRKIR